MSLLKMLQEGYRMDEPNNAACSQKTLVIIINIKVIFILWFDSPSIYRYELVILQCWSSSPDERPSFSELVITIENMLTSMANYIDFNQFTLAVEEQKG